MPKQLAPVTILFLWSHVVGVRADAQSTGGIAPGMALVKERSKKREPRSSGASCI
ncbi:hypothetical protein [Sphingobium sp.]|uniref:hypothetical protein n=1 Tax=Sphingobium sp. TaxID=1912891 RepID=UPI003BB6AA47